MITVLVSLSNWGSVPVYCYAIGAVPLEKHLQLELHCLKDPQVRKYLLEYLTLNVDPVVMVRDQSHDGVSLPH